MVMMVGYIGCYRTQDNKIITKLCILLLSLNMKFSCTGLKKKFICFLLNPTVN